MTPQNNTITTAGEVYGEEYGLTMQKLRDVNQGIREAEVALERLLSERQDLINQGDEIIKESFEWAHREGSPNNQPAIEPITGDIDVGLYD